MLDEFVKSLDANLSLRLQMRTQMKISGLLTYDFDIAIKLFAKADS